MPSPFFLRWRHAALLVAVWQALCAVGRDAATHGLTVTAFYVSNVAQYPWRDGKSGAFYLGAMQAETRACAE